MLIMPELAVALRRELESALQNHESEVVALSTWSKARSTQAEASIRALREALALPMPLVLWQKGVWSRATAARDEIGGELTQRTDMVAQGQLWLFDSISLAPAVKKRFLLPDEARPIARVLLPLRGARERDRKETQEALDQGGSPECGTAMGYAFQRIESGGRAGLPFLRLLPDLYPGEFIADPHINFIAALRYANRYKQAALAPGRGNVFTLAAVS